MKYIAFALLSAWILTSFTGCTSTPFEIKQDKVLSCTKDLMANDAAALESFEVCRQVYRLKRLNGRHHGQPHKHGR